MTTCKQLLDVYTDLDKGEIEEYCEKEATQCVNGVDLCDEHGEEYIEDFRYMNEEEPEVLVYEQI